jgi:hypothetical protein
VARAAGAEVLDEPRRGYGQACLRGLRHIPLGVRWILFCDADGSDDLNYLPALFAAAQGHDLVLGNRFSSAAGRAAMTMPQRLGTCLAVALIRRGWGVSYSDLGPLRLLKASALKRLNLRERGCGWTIEMQVRAVEAGLRVMIEVPVRYGRRQGGRSKISGSMRGVVRAGSAILWTLARLCARRALGRPAARLSASMPWNRSTT